MSVKTVEQAITAAENLNETLNAFLEIDREGALERAAAIENSDGALAVCRSPLKTTSVSWGCKPPAVRESLATIIRLTTPPSSNVSPRQAASSSAKQTATSLRWVRRMKTPLWTSAKSVGHDARARWLVGWIGGSGRRGNRARRTRFRHGRLCSSACFALRRRRFETDIRTQLALRSRRVRVVVGPGRNLCAQS